MSTSSNLSAASIRRKTVELSCRSGAGHLAPSLSCVEMLTVLFRDFLAYKKGEPRWEGRDRLIFSKGHGAYAYYVILNELGFLPDSELESFYHGASIKGCLTANPDYMLEASTGSLGHGLPIAVGIAKAFKIQNRPNRVVCIVGDGEMQEGSNYEALQFAYRYGLDNLLLLIDANDLQAMGRVDDVGLDNDKLAEVVRCYSTGAFHDLDGHDEDALIPSMRPFFERQTTGGLTTLFCRTVKGKGLPMIENKVNYHFRCPTEDGFTLEGWHAGE